MFADSRIHLVPGARNLGVCPSRYYPLGWLPGPKPHPFRTPYLHSHLPNPCLPFALPSTCRPSVLRSRRAVFRCRTAALCCLGPLSTLNSREAPQGYQICRCPTVLSADPAAPLPFSKAPLTSTVAICPLRCAALEGGFCLLRSRQNSASTQQVLSKHVQLMAWRPFPPPLPPGGPPSPACPEELRGFPGSLVPPRGQLLNVAPFCPQSVSSPPPK